MGFDSYQDMLKAMHAEKARYRVELDAGAAYVVNPKGERIARAFYEADANTIAKAMNAPHVTPILTALTDFVVMAEQENMQPGRTANASTLGQWRALVRDGRSIINSLKQ